MYPFPQSVTPAVRSHMDAQMAFLNELSQTMSRSFQQVFQLNMQLGQTLLQEATSAGQRMMTTERPTDALSAAASHAQPAADTLRAYQQQLSQLAATTQVDLTRVTEQHVQETSRTARALADDVTRAAVEETNKNSRDAFRQEAERAAKSGAQFQGNLQSGAEGAGGKSDSQAGRPNAPGNMQGGSAQPGNKTPSQAR